MTSADKRHFDAAEGWLYLGDWQSANAELEELTPRMRAHPDVLVLRCEIYAKAEKWEQVVEVASTLVKHAPKLADGWIHRSFALHVLKRTQEAFDLLQPAAELCPRLWTIPYNLSCYAAQLRRMDDAEKWFKRAMELNERAVKASAIDDPDLNPLWEARVNSGSKQTD